MSTVRCAIAPLEVVNLRAFAGHDDPVAVIEIAHRVGERRERYGVGANEHRALAEANGERRASTRPDQQVVFAREQKRQRKRAAQTRQSGLDGLNRR